MAQNITQPKVFLGCYVQRFSATFGLNSTPTSVEVTLIAGTGTNQYDVTQGATGFMYTAAEPGSVTGFSLGNFNFAGIITAWSYNESANGNSFNVRMSDPRIMFNNVPLVLDGLGFPYTTGIVLDNYLNVFRYYGSPDNADSTENGMTWYKIRDFLEVSGVINAYNVRMKPHFSSGFLNYHATNNPSGIPIWYRINADQPSVEECISQVANDMGMDYYAYLEPSGLNASSINTIEIKHIFRDRVANSADIISFLNGLKNSGTRVESTYGKELRTEPTTCLVQGPPYTYWVTPQANEIKNVWGRANDGTLVTTDPQDLKGIVLLDHIVGSGSNRITNTVTIDKIIIQKTASITTYPPSVSRTFTTQSVSGYEAPELVLRASLHSQEAWEAMMYKISSTRTFAQSIGIAQRFRDATGHITPQGIKQAFSISFMGSGITNRDDTTEELITAVYEATKATAEENYGKRWLVKAGTSNWLRTGSYDSSELIPRIEFKPSEATWSEDLSAPYGATSNHPNLNTTFNPNLKDSQGRLKSFMSIVDFKTKVDNTYFPYPIDLSKFTPENYFIESQGPKLVIPLSVEPYDKNPEWFIVETPDAIEGIAGTGSNQYGTQRPVWDFLAVLGYAPLNISTFDFMFSPDDVSIYGLASPRLMYLPYSANVYGWFIGVESNIQTWGNCFATGSIPGGLKIIKDDSLAPWTYGSYLNYSTACTQLALRGSAPSTKIDLSDITVAGLPDYNLGDPIGQSAVITAISAQYGPDGFTTSYQLRTFAFPPQRITKLLQDKITKTSNALNYAKKQIVNLNNSRQEEKEDSINKSSEISDVLTSLSNIDDFGYMAALVRPSASGI